MIHWLSSGINTYFGHPLRGAGYLWWSGAGSDLGELTLVGIALGWARHHNCEQKGCWRLGHAHPDHGQPVCRKHVLTGARDDDHTAAAGRHKES